MNLYIHVQIHMYNCVALDKAAYMKECMVILLYVCAIKHVHA